MTTVTIHAEDAFAVALRSYAAGLGKSVNQAVKDVFAPILGLGVATEKKENPWARFSGALPDLDCSRWDDEIKATRTVDEELWK